MGVQRFEFCVHLLCLGHSHPLLTIAVSVRLWKLGCQTWGYALQSCAAFGKHWDECAFGFLTHSLFLSLGVSRLSTMEFHFVPQRVASITTPPGCVGAFKPQFVVVIKFFVARARWWDPLRYMWGHLNVWFCRRAWFLEPSFLWAVQCIHCSIAAPGLQYTRGLLGLKNINELKHFGWQVAFLHAGCRLKWLLASMLACSPCVAGRHVELYDGKAAPIAVYGISCDN